MMAALMLTLRYSTQKAQALTANVATAKVQWRLQLASRHCTAAPAAAAAMGVSMANNAGGNVERFSSRVRFGNGASGMP